MYIGAYLHLQNSIFASSMAHILWLAKPFHDSVSGWWRHGGGAHLFPSSASSFGQPAPALARDTVVGGKGSYRWTPARHEFWEDRVTIGKISHLSFFGRIVFWSPSQCLNIHHSVQIWGWLNASPLPGITHELWSERELFWYLLSDHMKSESDISNIISEKWKWYLPSITHELWSEGEPNSLRQHFRLTSPLLLQSRLLSKENLFVPPSPPPFPVCCSFAQLVWLDVVCKRGKSRWWGPRDMTWRPQHTAAYLLQTLEQASLTEGFHVQWIVNTKIRLHLTTWQAP